MIAGTLLIAFLASRLIYGWVNRAGLQPAGFSPALASVLTAPILVFVVYSVLLRIFYGTSIGDWLATVFRLLLIAPIIPVLALLLAVYLRGGFGGKKGTLALCAAVVLLLILNCLWFSLAAGSLG
jgi:hypothetical protein